MAKWRWVNGSIKGNCAGCNKPLFQDRASGIVEYDAPNMWHLHCVLDKLPDPNVTVKAVESDIYGMMGGYLP